MLPEWCIGTLTFNSYKSCAVMAALFSGTVAYLLFKKYQIKKSLLCVFCLAAMSLVGARLFHFCMHSEVYGEQLQLWSLQYQGLSIYGGFFGATLGLWIWCKMSGERFWKIADLLVLPVVIATIILKLGCFLNGCCRGITTDSFMGMTFPSQEVKVQALRKLPFVRQLLPQVIKAYPIQLFEMIAAASGIVWLVIAKKFHLGEGISCLIYAIWFTLARLLLHPIHSFAEDYPKMLIYGIYPSIYISVILIAIAIILYKFKKKKV